MGRSASLLQSTACSVPRLSTLSRDVGVAASDNAPSERQNIGVTLIIERPTGRAELP